MFTKKSNFNIKGKRGLKAFEKRGLMKIFKPKTTEVRGDWTKFHWPNGELRYFYPS
jgi:hypothetical protein